MTRATVGLVLWLFLCLAVGWLGSQFRPGEWYIFLAKPSWTPPSGVFAPVWTLLYVMMGVAAWLVWKRWGFDGASGPLGLFFLQLALNALWSYLFFGRRDLGGAAVEVVILWLLILATAVAFWRKRPIAGALLLPYLCWVGFASALNYQIWRLNA